VAARPSTGAARGLATGQGELDRLLGPTPRLQATGALNGGRIEVERAALTGAQGSAGARGLIEGDGRCGWPWTGTPVARSASARSLSTGP
jgi:hypothetical protein